MEDQPAELWQVVYSDADRSWLVYDAQGRIVRYCPSMQQACETMVALMEQSMGDN